MKVVIYDGIRILKTENGNPKTFKSKQTAYRYLKRIGRFEDVGTKIKLVAQF